MWKRNTITEHKDYTWKVKANDENILLYGSREYVKDNKEINRLLTAHSRTESNQRVRYSENGRTKSAPPPLFNDSDFRTSANHTIIPQSPNNDEETYTIPNQNTSNTHFITQDSISNLSLEEQISLAKENQKTLNAMPKASDIDKDINKDNTQENTQTQDTTQRVETQSQKSTLRRK